MMLARGLLLLTLACAATPAWGQLEGMVRAKEPVWSGQSNVSPDGARMVMFYWRPGKAGGSGTFAQLAYLMVAEGATYVLEQTMGLSRFSRWYDEPVVSPDGKYVAYVNKILPSVGAPPLSSDLCICPIVKNKSTPVLVESVQDPKAMAAVYAPCFGPEGRYLCFLQRDATGALFVCLANPTNGSQLRKVPLPSKDNVSRAIPLPGTEDVLLCFAKPQAGKKKGPEIKPTQPDETSGIWSLRVLDTSSGQVKSTLLESKKPIAYPVISRDGRWVAYADSSYVPLHWRIWVCALSAGAKPLDVAESLNYPDADGKDMLDPIGFSEDNSRLICVRYRRGCDSLRNLPSLCWVPATDTSGKRTEIHNLPTEPDVRFCSRFGNRY